MRAASVSPSTSRTTTTKPAWARAWQRWPGLQQSVKVEPMSYHNKKKLFFLDGAIVQTEAALPGSRSGNWWESRKPSWPISLTHSLILAHHKFYLAHSLMLGVHSFIYGTCYIAAPHLRLLRAAVPRNALKTADRA
jgi:hypothetical protein